MATTSSEELTEILEVRLLLEPWVTARAATMHTAEELAALDGAVDLGWEGVRDNRPALTISAHHRFLQSIARMSGHTTAVAALTPLHHRTLLAFAAARTRVRPEGWQIHQDVRDALAARAGARAEALTRDHLTSRLDGSGH